MSSLFVGNLSSHVRHRELENTFRRFGRCSLELKEGFGFVSYEDHRDAKRALEALQGRSVCGEQPSISWARKRRPFQRFFGKGNFVGRDRYYSRRRPSMETDKGSDDGRRDEKFVGNVKEGLRASEVRDESVRSTERDAEWKDSAPQRMAFDEETKDADILDSGRWDPHMEGSPDNMLVEGLLEDEQHPLDDKDKEDERGSVHEKSQGSPRDRHHERSSRIYRNTPDQNKRGRDTFGGRQQERCYNCGQSGHVKWQCRSRPRRINTHTREGGYDGRRKDLRYLGSRGGFRGIGGGGRFRGSNGARRMLARDVELGYGRRSSRRHEVNSDRKHLDPEDIKMLAESRRRRRRSESPRDSSSRGRSKSKRKRKHKKSSKKAGHSTKKRRRSSSGSPSTSHSQNSASSSPSRSGSHSESRSRSSKSGSDSSESAGSGSHSQSESQSSRSRSSSAGSSSRSRSISSQSRNSVSRSRSQSPLSRSQESHGISSLSPKAKRTYSPRSSSTGGSLSPTLGEDKGMVTSDRLDLREEAVHERPVNDQEDKVDTKFLSECHNMDPHDAKRSERRRVWWREARKQKIVNSHDDEEPQHEAEPQSNGVNHALKSVKADGDQLSAQQGGTVNDSFSKVSDAIFQSQVSDVEHNVYMAIMEEGGGKGAGGGQDWANSQFGAARLWPWEAMLYRRLKRGPISTANYERRKAQNEEFGIIDTFVRSSSGWWENPIEE